MESSSELLAWYAFFGDIFAIIIFLTDYIKHIPYNFIYLIVLLLILASTYSLNVFLKEFFEKKSINYIFTLFISIIFNIYFIFQSITLSLAYGYHIMLIVYFMIISIMSYITYKQILQNINLNAILKLLFSLFMILIVLTPITIVVYPYTQPTKILSNFMPSTIRFTNENLLESQLVMKILRGNIWDVNITNDNDNLFNIYIDGLLNGHVFIEYLQQGRQINIPISVEKPSKIEPGFYDVNIIITYKNYFNEEIINNNIMHVEVEPTYPGPVWSLYATGGIMILVIAYVVYKEFLDRPKFFI